MLLRERVLEAQQGERILCQQIQENEAIRSVPENVHSGEWGGLIRLAFSHFLIRAEGVSVLSGKTYTLVEQLLNDNPCVGNTGEKSYVWLPEPGKLLLRFRMPPQ